ncbi:hypothetical protein [Roseomonas sp. 18066]|uniref:hypothetical protein n=1 Tax=Roseomonas sp. 18066 TaxID=2681412 RepID=UPI001356F46C|nr:hypothetical protein [Roseomonas sp. 18066]
MVDGMHASGLAAPTRKPLPTTARMEAIQLLNWLSGWDPVNIDLTGRNSFRHMWLLEPDSRVEPHPALTLLELIRDGETRWPESSSIDFSERAVQKELARFTNLVAAHALPVDRLIEQLQRDLAQWKRLSTAQATASAELLDALTGERIVARATPGHWYWDTPTVAEKVPSEIFGSVQAWITPKGEIFAAGKQRYHHAYFLTAEVAETWPLPSPVPGLDGQRSGVSGRPTSRHLIESHMAQRAADGLLAPTLTEECRHLSAWLRETHPLEAQIKPKSATEALRARWRELTTRKP